MAIVRWNPARDLMQMREEDIAHHHERHMSEDATKRSGD